MYLHNLSTIKLLLLLPQHNTMGENSRKILSPSKANALIEVVKSHSPQCVSVLLSVQYRGCITPGYGYSGYVGPRTQAPVSDEIIW